MKLSELLKARLAHWQELETLCSQMEGRSRRRQNAATVVRLSTLYRSACADLALADAYQLPPDAIHYLHGLVGRAHNQLYRSRTFNFSTWSRQLLVEVPRRLFSDNCLRLAFCIFWGVFLLSTMMAYSAPDYAERVAGREWIMRLEEDFSQPITDQSPGSRAGMAGFYILNNTSIGLQCFALGLLFGVGGLFVTVFNAAFLGAAFGHMATIPQGENFFHFVTAHGPFELTAVVLSAGAGMRLGFSLIDTKGLTRVASLRRASIEAMPTMGATMAMFLLAALIEAFVSPSAAPYWIKATVGVLSAGLLTLYFVALGYPRGD
ncbi:MAG: stage II sporulation protein M [Planctomycetota bacterium]|jgi:uncharacterized membrane protein SpoIIM required for sporulation